MKKRKDGILNMLSDVTTDLSVVCSLKAATPIAYLNVYEKGDLWVKTKGCETCPLETRRRCCGNCASFTDDGCNHQLKGLEDKPWYCIIKPYPSACMSFCGLEFKCTAGTKKGKARRVRDRGDIFR